MKKSDSIYHKKSGFKVSNTYFEDFESRILDAIPSNNKPLDGYKRQAGFHVPDNYFNSLEEEVLSKIVTPKGRLIPLHKTKKFYYSIAVAAMFIGLISSLFIIQLNKNNIDSVELSAIESYIDNGYIELDLNELSSFMYDEGYAVDNLTSSNLSEEAVFRYLNENVEDPALILE
ncbi:hypothetical protein L1I30_08995 [Gillisia sp. M10.2A]|uniref:Uncharacterized protein n=1 Tax=Gillisia lutea TaxID=2909668 RepID=A0ABS9EFZ5_9FLAO|nr:hypothetical protein [Gillisia lutea]MCF4101800.1 hypothetical protein [Gillisia lutea]